jgi:peptide chain release factor subunit 1
MAAPTWDLLRKLAGFRAASGRAISLYLNLDPSLAPTQPAVAARVSSLLTDARRQVEEAGESLGHEQRVGLKADLERIEHWFEEEFDRDGARGVAVFSDGPDGLWVAQTVPEPVTDAVRVGTEVYLAPLTGLVGRPGDALVAYVGRERAEVYKLQDGRLVEIADESEEVPSQHDQGGRSQARYERHIEEIVARHLRRVADTLEGCVRKLRGVRIVLIGPESVRPEFEEMLAADVRDALLGWTTAEAHAGAPELLAAARPLLDEAADREEQELLERWREEAARNGRASAGWPATLEAASDGRVELLLASDGADRPAFRCPKCGRVQVDGGNCPLDGTELEPREDGLDLAVHQTLVHGGTVRVIRDRPDLEPVEGIGALLRF